MAARLILLLTLALAGCQSVTPTFCDLAEPIRMSDRTVDAMTDAEVEQVLTHNLTGAKACGWKP